MGKITDVTRYALLVAAHDLANKYKPRHLVLSTPSMAPSSADKGFGFPSWVYVVNCKLFETLDWLTGNNIHWFNVLKCLPLGESSNFPIPLPPY